MGDNLTTILSSFQCKNSPRLYRPQSLHSGRAAQVRLFNVRFSPATTHITLRGQMKALLYNTEPVTLEDHEADA